MDSSDVGSTRPTSIFKKENDGSAGATSSTSFSAISPASGNGSNVSSPSFLPEIPQWKKELIQRRKSNVARTIVAGGIGQPYSQISQVKHYDSENKTNSVDYENHQQKVIIPGTATVVPATNSLDLNSPAVQTNTISPTLASKKQRAEKFIGVGGHYTPQASDNGENENVIDRGDTADDDCREIFPSHSIQQESSVGVPIPKQRSLFLISSTANASTSLQTGINRNQTKEQLETTACTTFATSSISANVDINSHICEKRGATQSSNTTFSTTTKTPTRLTSYSTLRENGMQESQSKCGTSVGASTTQQTTMQSTKAKTLPTTGAYPTKQQQQQFQLGFKNESEWTSSAINENRVATTLEVIDCEKKTVKISNKLQNNQFIRNQQVNSKVSTKYTKNIVKLDQENSSLTSELSGSHTKTSTIKKKMVAVQEMKKTTQNVNYHRNQQQEIIGSASCGQQIPSQEADFDSSEDLSYGPGIVSKLRCRYLSLALRESMEKQRYNLENLRRATSLNNLLDRNDHKNEDVDDNDQEMETVDNNVESKTVEQNANVVNEKLGILKQINKDDKTQESIIIKKTGTFQKTASSKENNELPKSPLDQQRSRHLKRGNDSLKRARSVEALLCERSPWNFVTNRSSLNTTSNTTSEVTIEDKICNARERLILGVDSMPPKRLTSIIDDTERPPPDLVKQTLKLFEASANKRGRGSSSTNGKGDVASKVANYKSIIKENKPTIFPKPNLSPTKRPNAKPTMKTVGEISPSNNGNAKNDADMHQMKSSTPKQKNEHKVESNITVRGQNFSSSVKSNPITPIRASGNLRQTAVIDSPVTSLMKRLEQLHIDPSQRDSPPPPSNASKKHTTIIEQQNTKLSAAAPSHDVVGDSAAAVADVDADGNGYVYGDGSENEKHVVGGDAAIATKTITTPATIITNTNIVSTSDKNDRDERDEIVQTGIATSYGSDISSDLSDGDECGVRTKRISKTALENIARAGTTQQFKFAENSSVKPNFINSVQNLNQNTNLSNSQNNSDIAASVLGVGVASGKQIGVIRPLLTTQSTATTANALTTSNASNMNSGITTQFPDKIKQQQSHFNYTNVANSSVSSSSSSLNATPALTNREIEKNRINEMKKTASTELSDVVNTSTNASLLDTVITTGCTSSSLSNSPSNSLTNFNELDAVTANNSPLWALRRKRQNPTPAVENTSMVFNFSNRKEVPDYIENDGVIFRRKRELPKPNESGFVLLGDISLETSTDTDYDDFSTSPPSPCNVEFENANIVIDGKSSIRQKPKGATGRVQFDDSLTSTFEYPSEASMIVEDSLTDLQHLHYGNSDDFVRNFESLSLDDADSPQRHHHVAVEEIIQLPTQPNTNVSSATEAASPLTKNILGNLPLGSAPLGFYSPIKAPINNLFQLGVTRAPTANGHVYNANSIEAANVGKSKSAINISNGTDNDNKGCLNGGNVSMSIISDSEQPESEEYLKPANDDLTIAYSEGAHKTDLLY